MEPAEIDDLARAYNAGTSIKDLAVQFEINRSTVLAHLADRVIRRRHPALNPEQKAEVCRLYEEGLSSTEVGLIYDVSPDTILRAAREMGIKVRNRA
jgi:DNA-binding CsgD family transcriptional regulator